MFVILGTGRSGTQWCADVLTEQGVPTGHEAIFTPTGRRRINALRGDSSWLALPYLENGADVSGPIVHVVREPVGCIQSMLRIGKFGGTAPTAYTLFAQRHCRDAYRLRSPFLRACRFWITWNQRCAALAGVTLPLEALTVPRLLAAVGETGNDAACTVPRDANHRQRVRVEWPRVEWRDLPGDVKAAARAFGYAEHLVAYDQPRQRRGA